MKENERWTKGLQPIGESDRILVQSIRGVRKHLKLQNERELVKLNHSGMDDAFMDGCGLPRQMKREANDFSRVGKSLPVRALKTGIPLMYAEKKTEAKERTSVFLPCRPFLLRRDPHDLLRSEGD
jgi:hypothetical protein